MDSNIIAPSNISGKTEEKRFKTVYVDNATGDETLLRVGNYAEAQAALEVAEQEAAKGKYDLRKGHFAMLHADPRLQVESKPAAKAEPAKTTKSKLDEE